MRGAFILILSIPPASVNTRFYSKKEKRSEQRKAKPNIFTTDLVANNDL